MFSFGAAYLGPSYTPFSVVGDPSTPSFKVPNLAPLAEVAGRFDDRTRLLAALDRLERDVDRQKIDSHDRSCRQAIELISSPAARTAFDLTREPAALRDRYGRHCWGQRALLARRLVEAGCSFVTMVLENPYQSGIPWLSDGTYNWDSHAVNCHIFNDLKMRLPIYDQAVTALVEDLYARGLDKRVLLVVTGEFGRTPRLESQVGTQTHVRQPGRDHWPQAMSMLVAGGGMRTGQVIGATDAKGEHPKDRHLSPNDLWATVYRHLGIDPQVSFPDAQGPPLADFALRPGDPRARLGRVRIPPRRQNAAQAACSPVACRSWSAAQQHSHVQFYGKRQGGRLARAIFLWRLPFFCAAEKPEKSGFLCKNCSENSSWTLG